MKIDEDDVFGSYLLIIEGGPAFSNSLPCLLFTSHYVTNTANRGSECYGFASLRLPRLILLSGELPDCDGFSVYRKIQASSSLAKITAAFLKKSNCLAGSLASVGAGGLVSVCFLYSPEKTLVRVARQYSVKHLSNNLSLKLIARTLEVSAKCLAGAFKTQAAITLNKFFGRGAYTCRIFGLIQRLAWLKWSRNLPFREPVILR